MIRSQVKVICVEVEVDMEVGIGISYTKRKLTIAKKGYGFMKRIIWVFVLLFGMLTQTMAQQTISNEDFEINLPSGWNYTCTEDIGEQIHSFEKDSVSYGVHVFVLSFYAHSFFEICLPVGMKYVETEGIQMARMEDGGEVWYRKVQGDEKNPNVSGCIYITTRNDRTIVVKELNRSDSLVVGDNLLEQFRWADIKPMPFPERVDRFCEVFNGTAKNFVSQKGLCFKHSAKDKRFIIEYRVQTPEEEAKLMAKGEMKKEDVVRRFLFYTFPILKEMGNEGYTFQLSKYLMNGELGSEVVCTPEDYKGLLKKGGTFVIQRVEE